MTEETSKKVLEIIKKIDFSITMVPDVVISNVLYYFDERTREGVAKKLTEINIPPDLVEQQAKLIRKLEEEKRTARTDLLRELITCVVIAPEFEDMPCVEARKIIQFLNRAIEQEERKEH